MPTTEFAIFPLAAGSDIGDPSNHAAVGMKASLDVVARQDGCRQILFGTQVENPGNVELAVTWDGIKNHQDFMGGPEYPSLMSNLKGMVAGKGQMHHVDFKPDGAATKVFSAPVTEVATLYFDGKPPSDQLENMLKFVAKVEEGAPEGFLGATAGLTHEEIEKDGVKGIGAMVTVGWQSVDAHMKFRESQLFKDIIELLGKDHKAGDMHHTAFMQFIA
nr:hypothetical protein CFP56_42189 [Quercus suber]